jgi:hypothetical protein
MKAYSSPLHDAVMSGDLTRVKHWLLKGNDGAIAETDSKGNTPLLISAIWCQPMVTQYLLEHGGANIADVNNTNETIWDLLEETLLNSGPEHEVAVTDLLKVMVLRGAPSAELATRLLPEFVSVIQKGARLRTALPDYLARRQALLDTHCPLLPPLRAIVNSYEEPTTTEELWATGLGSAL